MPIIWASRYFDPWKPIPMCLRVLLMSHRYHYLLMCVHAHVLLMHHQYYHYLLMGQYGQHQCALGFLKATTKIKCVLACTSYESSLSLSSSLPSLLCRFVPCKEEKGRSNLWEQQRSLFFIHTYKRS